MAVDDELLNRITWKIPNALALVGSAHDGERNAMTTSWITQLSMEPVLIGIGVDNSAVTHRLISAGGAFTVNLWDSENTRPFVKFSKPAVDDGDTLNGWAVHAATTGAPVFDDAIAWMDCEVRRSTWAATRCSSARSSMPRSGRRGRSTTGQPHIVRR
jgi:flavin reductase (DIM6/NTAB) family NADH-FMN oxidoreductase RutF